MSVSYIVIMPNAAQERTEKTGVIPPLAIFGAAIVALGVVFQVILAGIIILNWTFDVLVLLPLIAIAVGLVFIKIAGQKIRKAVPAILEGIIELFFPFF